MRTSRVALTASVLAGATALALGVAFPSLAGIENRRAAALDDTAQLHTTIMWKKSSPAAPTRAQPFTINGEISGWTLRSDGSLQGPYFFPPEGTELAVRRTDVESPSGTPLGVVKVGDQGTFALTDTPPAGGKVQYTFSYPGSARFSALTATLPVDIPRLAPSLRMDKHNTVHTYGSTVTVTAALGTTHKNRVVEFWSAEFYQGERLLKRATVNSAGKATVSLKLTRNTWVSARFTGDGRYAPVAPRADLLTKVSIDTKLTRHYQTKKIGATTYQYFRRSTNPLVTHTMTPDRGRMARTTIQIYRGGKWQLWSRRDTKLATSGKASFSFVAAAKAGTKFRVRAEFLGTGPYKTNHPTVGTWKYFTYTK